MTNPEILKLIDQAMEDAARAMGQLGRARFLIDQDIENEKAAEQLGLTTLAGLPVDER
ncbi:hypothetical protein GGD81_004171 [Rhodobium orientis]|uniref:Uncharacterized protein n=1 Tax=Rhodobium gokarnense TaxID=364296 RepID=A0ABT3HEQ4_9HYPH|nr:MULTISPECIES: hypothetical protein [Rhodobium]MBB4305103.1 hypothetical protein [Rhodobium orientis]MCW2308855.1 hypothetical protein [Rhodobium gokarnense]